MPRKPPEKPNKPPKKDDDWSVEWPDGSWLTWNEETGTWDKREAPKGRAKSSQRESTTRAARTSTSAKKAAAKTTTTSSKPEASAHSPIADVATGQVPGKKPAQAPVPASSGTGWRPQAERSAPVVPVERSTQIRLDRSTAVPPRAQPIHRQEDRWPVPAIAAGAVAGVAAGYLLTFLVA